MLNPLYFLNQVEMAYYCIDNVYTKTLSPREPNVELLDAACKGNIIVCLCNSFGKTFIASLLTQHIINKANGNKRTLTLYVADVASVVTDQAAYFQRLTNITVGEFHTEDEFNYLSWEKAKKDQIFFMETPVAVALFEKEILVMSDVNLLILHGCQCILRSGTVAMRELMKNYYESPVKPHVLGLAGSLFSSEINLSHMESSFLKMEETLNCKIETASNITSILRYGTQPHDVILEFAPPNVSSIDRVIEEEILNAIEFIRDHRYDPMEIYEGFFEELQNIPDPKCEPEEVLLELLNILHTLGPWSADRAALVLLLQLEKLKVTTPYERHFLLLCMTSSVLVKIRAILEDFFKDIEEKDRIYKYTSPKMLRVFEILRKFQPEKGESDSDEYSDQSEDEENDNEMKITERAGDASLCPFLLELDMENQHFDCDCELMTAFLLKRLKYQELCNVTFQEFVDMIKNRKSALSMDCHKKVIESKQNRIETDNSIMINDNPTSANQPMTEVSKKQLNDFQKKNGYLPGSNGKILNFPVTAEKRINEVNTLENYLQYHEYLFLPKFKVDRHTRYDCYNVSNQLKGVGGEEFLFRQAKNFGDVDFQLCGLIFVERKFTAKVLFHVLNDLKQADEDFSFLSVQFTVGKVIDGSKDPKGAETEHRKQELMLKRFRMRACNVLIGTSFLEEGIDLPKCNLVIRFDIPKDYRSYINTKERARATDSLHCLLVDSSQSETLITNLGKYYETERMLLRKCGNLEPSEAEEKEADEYSRLIQPFCPLLKQGCPYVDLSTAIASVNRYCAKLPSDTFTRLTPIWDLKKIDMFEREMFVCSIRLPINSPVKQEIKGIPMPTRVLARRFAAFQCCQILHLMGELDDTLQPISKETYWMREEEQLTSTLEELEEMIPKDSMEPRPGTTKRRQYYYKKIADSLTDCLPLAGKPSYLYHISMALTCPLPEEQNTRGRKIHPPEDSFQGFGILTRKKIPKIGAFPIFTRSGEVQVKLQLAQSSVVLSEPQIDKIVAFIHYTFTSVLRLQKHLMMFDPDASENSYFIVPTKKGAQDIFHGKLSAKDVAIYEVFVTGENPETVEVDWEFLELIYEKRNQVLVFIPEEERKNFVFDPTEFEDAVVSPWYRNQDQPQYLYVAEICSNLNPKSAFPGTEYKTFEEYYLRKYEIQIQNCTQALLDVDHTSARLNFLTPRYVNRKGVALPTTSEEKKRAKRENLKQKQILVPELCDIHPFPATLWRKAVCLPCILHRVNALLLADQLRRLVATEIGVGSTNLPTDFDWQPLSFGWSLADVLKHTRQKQKEEISARNDEIKQLFEDSKVAQEEDEEKESSDENGDESGPLFEIGTWSNEMAYCKDVKRKDTSSEYDEDSGKLSLPGNITMIDKADLAGVSGWHSDISVDFENRVRYCSPTSWLGETKIEDDYLTDYMSESSYSDDFYDDLTIDTDSECGGLKIQFTEDNVAEAVEKNHVVSNFLKNFNVAEVEEPWCFEDVDEYSNYIKQFYQNLETRKKEILQSGKFFGAEKQFDFTRSCKNSKRSADLSVQSSGGNSENGLPFGNSNNKFPRLINDIPDDMKKLPFTDLIIKSLEEEEKKRACTGQKSEVAACEAPIPVNSYQEEEEEEDDICKNFSFDEQPDLAGHPGPSPSLILQALTMSNANDGINLERLETIGDSFLKYAITTYLYCIYENVHEGKLSHLRSKQVSNFNLYRLGRRKVLGESMIATKFEPNDNWLPPCYYVPRELERALIEAGVPASHWNKADLPSLRNLSREEICQLVREKGEKLGIVNSDKNIPISALPCLNVENIPSFIPYNLMTQHSIPDKSIADCVEALIGAYLVACGPRGALLFMSWLGIKVLPKEEKFFKSRDDPNIRTGVGCSPPSKTIVNGEEVWSQVCFGELRSPKQPLLRHLPNPEGELEQLLRGFNEFEDNIRYRFRDRSYLLQALTHASYSPNRLTDCYQRLEFLGDAVLDYLITRHLYEDSRHHSPGALTDLRSALVNNTIFASLAVRHDFHKYFRHLCPSLNEVVDRFVRIQQENGHSITEEFYLLEEDECEEAEDVEVPKALGDVFESVAGAIFLDSGMSLDAVWRVYFRIMKNEIELFSTNVPKSPVRELFELEPETAQFGKPEKLADGKRVRVTVEVFGKGLFNGIGRNYRIAKCTAAKCALRQLKRKGLLERRK